MPVSYQPVASSSFLDFTGYRITNATSVAAAYGFTDGEVFAPSRNSPGINVALVVARNQDPTALLSQNWGSREQALQQLNAAGTLWTTYGASTADYTTVTTGLSGLGFTSGDILNASNSNYIASQESRTVWVSITTQAQFQSLFNQTLMYSPSQNLYYWDATTPGGANGLSMPAGWNVTGLWFDTTTAPNASTLSSGATVGLLPGQQSIGNSTLSPRTSLYSPLGLVPQSVASLYNFPLNGQNVQTGAIGLIEPGTGSTLPGDQTGTTFQSQLNTYLTAIGTNGTGTVYVQGVNGQAVDNGGTGERSLDVGVVSAINPNSNIGLYNGSGSTNATGRAQASVFTAVQSAIWDTVNNPAVTSNSFGDSQSMAPGSPFYNAYWQLFVDAALRNQTTFIALGDGGSGNETANGLTNVEYNVTQPWNVLVGGTSLSTTAAALADQTLYTPGGSAFVNTALAGNLLTTWQLVAGGLTTMPGSAADAAYFLESVWNTYFVSGNQITGMPGNNFYTGYLVNSTGSGGVDVTQATPSYQLAYGLNPTTSDGYAPTTGRGVPDVSANAGGNLEYLVPQANMIGTHQDGGTSAASPLWASLGVQLNAIFNDQNLPNLGYMNDLLYTASTVAPASFNDVTLGNNTSSFVTPGVSPGKYDTPTGLNRPSTESVGPTGYGYQAGPGYDLTTGLGTPNGMLLARSMTAIAQAQMNFANVPSVITQTSNGGWTSGARQSLLVQLTLPNGSGTAIATGGSRNVTLSGQGSAAFAWTSRLAGQSEQSFFDPDLVRLFDMQGQGALGQLDVNSGDAVWLSIDGSTAPALDALLASPSGFADFQTTAGTARLARPVAVAETAGGANDQLAIARVRGDGRDSVSVSFYRVDDFNGSIGNSHPGDADYAAAAAGRAYQLTTGGTWLGGPGYGAYEETMLQHVNAGDIIAMELTNNTHGNTEWAFQQANESFAGQNVGHLWNYGLNTWGWEDTYGGGDRDYNDLVVQLDFTSKSGHGWIA
jgi:hypothetical protein